MKFWQALLVICSSNSLFLCKIIVPDDTRIERYTCFEKNLVKAAGQDNLGKKGHFYWYFSI